MTDEERAWFMYIYTARTKELRGWGFVRALVLWFAGIMVGYRITAILHDGYFYDGVPMLTMEHLFGGWGLKTILICGGATLNCLLLYYYWALPYKEDAEAGVKERVPMVVVRKEYYPVTGQYFITLKGWPKHLEVTEETYYNSTEGLPIMMERARKTAYLFGANDRVRVKPFALRVHRYKTE